MIYSISELKRSAKQAMKGNITSFMAALLISAGIIFLSSIPYGLVFGIYTESVESNSLAAIPLFFMLLLSLLPVIFVSPILNVGFAKITRNWAEGKHSDPSEVLIGFKNGHYILIAKCYIRVYLKYLWSLVPIVGWLIVIPKMFGMALVPFILSERPDTSSREIVQLSAEMMRGYKFKLFTLYFSFILWYFAITLTFGLLSVYVTPYIETTLAEFYLMLKGETSNTLRREI